MCVVSGVCINKAQMENKNKYHIVLTIPFLVNPSFVHNKVYNNCNNGNDNCITRFFGLFLMEFLSVLKTHAVVSFHLFKYSGTREKFT